MPVLRTVIQDTHQKLEAAGIPDARLEAEVLVMNVMRIAAVVGDPVPVV